MFRQPFRPRLLVGIVIAAVWAFAPTAAHADPCEGRLPNRAGEVFAGPVRYIVDGDGLCVGPSADPATWVEVRLADFDAPELDTRGGERAKALLARLAYGREVRCVAVRGRSGGVISYDRVIARCTLGSRRLGDLLRRAGGVEGGR